MRVVLVAPAARRARLRALLTDDLQVIAEVTTVSEARRVPEADAYLLAPYAGGKDDDTVEPLTARELEVLSGLADGLPNRAIAARLGISDETVKFHLSAIFGKLGASNRTDAVRQAWRRGIVGL